MLGCPPKSLPAYLGERRSASEGISLPSLDLICNEVSKVCHQYCCLIDIFHFFKVDYGLLLGTSDFMQVVFEHYALLEGVYLELSFIKATEIKEIVAGNQYSYFSSIDDFSFLLNKVLKRSGLALELAHWKTFLTQMIVSLFPNFLHYFLNPMVEDSELLQIHLNSVLLFLQFLKTSFKNDLDGLLATTSKATDADVGAFLKIFSDFLRQYYRVLYGKLVSWFEANCLAQYQRDLTTVFSLRCSHYSVASTTLISEASQASRMFSEEMCDVLLETLQQLGVSLYIHHILF